MQDEQNSSDQDFAILIIGSLADRSNEASYIYDAASSYSPDPNLTEPGKDYVYEEYIMTF